MSETTKQMAIAFLDMAINQKRPAEAADRCMGPYYRQHNPLAPDGREGFVDFLDSFGQQFPDLRYELKRAVAEGDLVMLHAHLRTSADDRGQALVDIFRFEDGKIVEHWDIVQPVPEQSANDNTMF